MIIRSLTADNFRKYKRLEINDVPEKGLITVSGANESGKTSIADALSFALFGRTFFTPENKVQKLIAWGEKNASVVLNFIKQDKAYQLTRIINQDGSTDAQLFDENNAELIADTPEETEQVLHDILGYGYETFSDSFYLVQRELSTPHPNSDSIKDMVGIGPYARISNEMREANERDDAALASLRPQYEAAYKDLQDLGMDDSWLPELIDVRDTLETDQDYKYQLVSQLRQSADEYPVNLRSFHNAVRKYKFFSILSDLLLAALLVSLGLWGAIKFFPERAQNVLMTGAVEKFNELHAWSDLWMPLAAAGIAIFFLIAMLFSWRVEDKQMVPLKQKAQLYSEALGESYNHANADVHDQFTMRSLRMVTEAHGGSLPLVKADAEKFALVHTLQDKLKSYHADASEADESIDALRIHMKEQQRHNEANLAVINGEINSEMERTEVAAGYRKQLSGYDMSIREHTRNIKVQNTAIDLLLSSAGEFTEAFNSSVTKTSGKILPFFTNDHYSNLKIDDELNVAVFSKEKNDFMDFDEISSGTQRQIMLALRIAMSEELAINNNNDKQFIILDEPFAFFDHQRTVATLEKLPEVSDIICQVWVASQEFPEGTSADKEVNCPDGGQSLIA